MWLKKQFGLRTLFLLMCLVAHAFAKPHFAKQLHVNNPDVISTWIPFQITISYDEAEGLTTHEETYVGLLGQYWLYRRTISSACCLLRHDQGSNEEVQTAIRAIFNTRDCVGGTPHSSTDL